MYHETVHFCTITQSLVSRVYAQITDFSLTSITSHFTVSLFQICSFVTGNVFDVEFAKVNNLLFLSCIHIQLFITKENQNDKI